MKSKQINTNICNKTNSSKQIGARQKANKSTARYEFSFSFNKHLNIVLIVTCLFLSVSGLSSQKLGKIKFKRYMEGERDFFRFRVFSRLARIDCKSIITNF